MPKIYDTYAYLLESNLTHEMDIVDERVLYTNNTFSKFVYEKSSGLTFPNYYEAYIHWIYIGRKEGFEYAKGKNTLLKIILKVKDEPELLPCWIEHHAELVGFENLIILDCGSTSSEHWKVLERYLQRLVVINFRKFYNSLHSINSNYSFFRFVANNCKYLTILDADEFLTAHNKGNLSKSLVTDILAQGNECVYHGTWLNNISEPVIENAQVVGSVNFRVDNASIQSGTINGKTIARNSIIFDIKHLGHNLHVNEVMKKSTKESFGTFIILHLKNLSKDLTRARSLKHLRSKALIPENLITHADIVKYINQNISRDKSKSSHNYYLDRFLDPSLDFNFIENKECFEASIIGRGIDHQDVGKSLAQFENFDFPALLKERLSKIRLPVDEMMAK